MAIFFLVVGLEVKRELDRRRALDRRQAALLPLFAAVGGMVAARADLPRGDRRRRRRLAGWGIPMATDVAFALGGAGGARQPRARGAGGLPARRSPCRRHRRDPRHRGLLHRRDHLGWLALAVAALAADRGRPRMQVHSPLVYVALGLVAGSPPSSRASTRRSPASRSACSPRRRCARPAARPCDALETADADAGPRPGGVGARCRSPSALEHLLHPWSSFVIAADLRPGQRRHRHRWQRSTPPTEAPVGARGDPRPGGRQDRSGCAGVALAVRLGSPPARRGRLAPPRRRWARSPASASPSSLFITELAFDDPDIIAAAKLGVLAGSLLRRWWGCCCWSRRPGRAGPPAGTPATPRGRRRPRGPPRPPPGARTGTPPRSDRRDRSRGAAAATTATAMAPARSTSHVASSAPQLTARHASSGVTSMAANGPAGGATRRSEARGAQDEARGDAERLGADVERVEQVVGDGRAHGDQPAPASRASARPSPRSGGPRRAGERDAPGVGRREERDGHEGEASSAAWPEPRSAATACCWSSICV